MQYRARAVDQERTEIDIAALADAEQTRLPATRVLPWDKTDPSGQLAPVLKRPRVSNACDECAGCQRSDAGNPFQATARFVFPMQKTDLLFELADVAIEVLEVLEQPCKELSADNR